MRNQDGSRMSQHARGCVLVFDIHVQVPPALGVRSGALLPAGEPVVATVQVRDAAGIVRSVPAGAGELAQLLLRMRIWLDAERSEGTS